MLARISLGRVGNSLPTRELLAFQLAHAKARDAVWNELDSSFFAVYEPVIVHSLAPDRATYLRRPDLGRRVADGSGLVRGDFDAVVILADGLSATAVDRHGGPVLDALLPLLEGWQWAPIVVALQARVAIGDEIGELLGAKMSIVLIGERPGLSSPDSLGAYLTWGPRVGRTDAERNCVSNIREEGLKPGVAAQRIAMLMRAARGQEISGVGLKAGTTEDSRLGSH
jgi:ethanolamine ammonia-lyase small subunit